MKKYFHFLAGLVLLVGCSPNEQKPVSIDLNANGSIEPYEDVSLSLDDRAADALRRLSLEQKAHLVVGMGMNLPGMSNDQLKEKVPGAAGNTYPLEVLGIPSIVLADGPAGLRINPTREGDTATYYCTAFPIATLLASTWDAELVRKIGAAMGNEVKEYGADVLLAPAQNIHRDPLGGRNFEYFSEDPLLSGLMSAAIVNGVESQGVGTSVKHFAVNNQETSRMLLDAIVSERALREIYLRGFEITIQVSQPWTVMSAYNKVNGTYASENEDLLTRLLREEWGFDGLVMTDWFAGTNAVAQMKAGNDLLMPGRPDQYEAILNAAKQGGLDTTILNANVKRILQMALQSPGTQRYAYSNKPALEANAQLARTAAAEGVVLMKNKMNVLPMQAGLKIAAFGNTSYDFISGGTGSGDVNEAYTVSLVQGMESAGYRFDESLKNAYAEYLISEKAKQPQKEFFFQLLPPLPEMEVSDSLLAQMVTETDVAIVTIGRNSGEFQDRYLEGDFYLTEAELSLIDRVSRAYQAKGKYVVVVLNIGNVVEMESWRLKPDAIVLAWQGGQEAGNALADVLSGKVNPSGKLPTTFPIRYEDVPSAVNFPGTILSDEEVKFGPLSVGKPMEVVYEEDIFVGYRYYHTFSKPHSFEFGYGMSYTQFAYNDLKLSETTFDQSLEVTVTIKNTGNVPGREVVQLYVAAPAGQLAKPAYELRDFAKTRLLKPGETQKLTFLLEPRDLASFDSSEHAWVAEAGSYTVHVGSSSRQLHQSATFSLPASRLVLQTQALLLPQREIATLKK